MDVWGFLLLIVGAVVLGGIAEYVVHRRIRYEWIAPAIAAFIGGYIGSEYSMDGIGAWGATAGGLHVFPALIGAVIVAGIVQSVIYITLLQPPAQTA